MARDASRLDVVLFALVVAVLPAFVIAVVAAATNLGGPAVRRYAHIGLVGALGGVVAWRFGTDLTGWNGAVLGGLALVTAAGLGALRWRVPVAASFLRFLGGASVMFLVLFLIASPSSDLVLRGSVATGSEAETAAVLEATGDDPPPIVTLVVDALPTAMLLDGEGNIDASLYPNLADLAGDSTWYRNYSTMSAWTYKALPTMFAGQLPGDASLPDASNYPENLISLFSGTHDIEAVEHVSRFCTTDICPRSGGSALGELLGDAANWWTDGADPDQPEHGNVLPGALEPDRAEEFEEWLAAQDFAAGDPANGASEPGLWYYHMVLPHEPWDVLADGTRYDVVENDPYGLFLNSWNMVGADVGRQRQLLQSMAVDRMIGDLLDDLRADGAYDDATIVVVGDHGQAFTGGEPLRGVTEEQYEQVIWAPLIVKTPGQDTAEIDETNLQSIDLMPTLAEALAIELPWEVEGLPPSQAAEQRDDATKQLLDDPLHEIEPDEGSNLITVDGAEGYDRVLDASAIDEPGAGEVGIWQRTEYGELMGESLDALRVADEQVAASLEVEQLERLEEQSGERLLLELIGEGELGLDTVVAIAANDEIVAVVPTAPPISLAFDEDGEVERDSDGEPVFRDLSDDDAVVHVLLNPAPFTLGTENTLTAYTVSGVPGDATLTPVDLISG